MTDKKNQNTEPEFWEDYDSESFNFVMTPRLLLWHPYYKKLSAEAKLLYAMMLDRLNLSKQNGEKWKDDDGHTFIIYTLESMCNDLNCGHNKIVTTVKELENYGLLFRKKQGQGKPTLLYPLKFNSKKLIEFEENNKMESSANSEKSLDNTENFQTSENRKSRLLKNGNQDFRKSEVKTSQNQKSRLLKNGSQDFRKSEGNYTNINNTENSYIINQSECESERLIDEKNNFGKKKENIKTDSTLLSNKSSASSAAEKIKENIGYKNFMASDNDDKDLFESLYRIICEVMIEETVDIKIGRKNLPVSFVQDVFLKLRQEHLLYVIEGLKNQTKQIKNPKAYIITSLYNSWNTIALFKANKKSTKSAAENKKEKNKFKNFTERGDDDYAELEKVIFD